MTATRDLIAAALTVAGAVRWQYPELSDDLREACARAMVEPAAPDMAEVERLLEAYDHEYASGGSVEDYDRARSALLDYVRDHFRDAAKMVQPVGEVPMPEPDIIHTGTDGELYGYWNEYQMIHYGDACKEAGYAAGVAAGGEVPMLDADATAYALHNYGDAREAAGYAAGVAAGGEDAERYRWLRRKFAIVPSPTGAVFHALNLPFPTYVAPDAAIELDAAIDAALRGEVKP